MSTIAELIKKIDSLSHQESNNKIFKIVKRNNQSISESKKIFMECKKASNNINSVFSDFEINYDTSIKEDLNSLIELLPEKSEFLGSQKKIIESEQRIKEIKEKCFASKADIKEKWKTFLEKRTLRYYPIKRIMTECLNTENTIEKNLKILGESGSDDAAFDCKNLKRIKVAIDEIENDCSRLDVEGLIGKFLTDVLDGKASAELLYDDEIRSFLLANKDLLNKLKLRIE